MQSDPLAQLRDIHQPEALGWWPLAPGWWAIIVLTIVLLSFFLIKYFLHKQRNQYRLSAQKELEQLTLKLHKNHDLQAYLTNTHKLLRRVALHHYSNKQQDFAGLTGAQWQNYLNLCCTEKIFGSDFSEHFTSLPYQKNSDFDHQSWRQAINRWLEQHQ